MASFVGAVALAATYATSAALADNIVLSGPSVVSAAPGTNVGFTAYLEATSGAGDLNNCNVNTGSGNAATLSFTSSNPAVADAPANVTVTGCDDPATSGFEGGVAVSVHVKSGATGSTTITVQGSGGRAAGPNTSAQYATDTLTVNVVAKQDQAALTVVAATPQTYGTTQLLTTSGGTTGGAVSYATSTPSVCSVTGASLTMLTGTGTCSVTATMAGSSSYHDVTSAPTSVAAAKAIPVVSLAGPSSATFGDAAFAVTGSVAGDNGTLAVSSLTTSVCTYAAGEVTIVSAGTCTIEGSTTADADYTAASTAKDITIGQAGSSVSVICPSSAVYTGDPIEPCSASVTGPSLSQSLTPSYSDNTAVGLATASASYAGDPNHTGNSSSATFEITKAESVVAVTCPSSRTFTAAALEPCTARVTGAGGLDQVLPVSYQNNVNAGTATASAAYAGDANHEGSTGSSTFTIDKAPSSTVVTCPSENPTYTGSAIEPCTAKVTGPGLDQVLSVSYQDNVNAGAATASASFAGDANHEASSGSTTFTIDKASSATTVSCTSPHTYTGSAIEPCTAVVTGAGGLDESLVVGYADNVDAGTATASASFAGDANHLGSSDSTTFEIEKAPSTTTVTCPTEHLTYTGAELRPCSAGVTGVGGLDEVLNPEYADNVNAGTATASASFPGDANHLGSSDSATFTIDKAASTTAVTCPASVVYNGAAQEPCAAAVTGAGGLDQLLVVGYADNVNAGTATASASYDGDANHEPSSDEVTFVIDKAASTTAVTCPASVVYDGAAQEPCTAAVTGAGGLDQPLSVSYADNVNAGAATASASYEGGTNHLPSSRTESFTITKKPVTVTASSATVTLGSPVPAVTPSYSGLVAGQDASVLTVAPTCGTTYLPSSPIGQYATSCSGAAAQNYSFTYQGGTITVVYPWSGFFQPIDTADGGKGKDSVVTAGTIFNKAKAGSSIPVKFSLGGDRGLSIFAAGYPKVQRVTCTNATTTADPIEETTTTSGLKYDATTQQYNYAWKTATSFAGSCQRLEVKLVDGQSYFAFFTFTK